MAGKQRTIFSHTKTTICHEKDDFTRLGLPKEGVIDSFINRHYDIIIDTTEQPDFFGKYITAASDANIKVGYTNTESDEDEGLMDMYRQEETAERMAAHDGALADKWEQGGEARLAMTYI